MKLNIAAIVILGSLAVPFIASAHEVQVFEIKGAQYQIVVGSLNEPLVVDDKSGVELRVTAVAGNKPVEGLEDSLKVELIAGNKRKVMDFETVYNTPGAYKAPFYPTVATTLSYRVYGEIADTPFDQTFTCNAPGHASAPEDKTRVEISEGVTRVSKTGAFGCPSPKTDMGFPEASSDLLALSGSKSGNGLATAALAISVIALVAAVARRRS
ncbi:MAG: hypothetical protein KBD06_01295 [Candidatus Pacebacteria bacterium]|nr:hypothetical protein [Candidatus Paceibacterota bacterium]